MTLSAPSVSAAQPRLRVISWNLLHAGGASLEEVKLLIETMQPDILLMQEVRSFMDALPQEIPGSYARATLPGRAHGTACWSRLPLACTPHLAPLPPGLFVRRNAQVLRFDDPRFGVFSIANVHLSHGQLLNRRQLRTIRDSLTDQAIIMGDFNQVGPVWLRHFRDVGPRAKTHRLLNRVPLRLDRCLVRGFRPVSCRVLPRFGSDHRAIAVTLVPNTQPLSASSFQETDPQDSAPIAGFTDKAATDARLRYAAARPVTTP
ncbi:endonuclease/exonuclease/phosphatase family protein [Oecophyllibacter saccharovorans]|uniref:Endonuclease/exonuclease/phosphatase family protein n=1 Tax=Oecophyllibacter saccharovorans TaxID=2558360 RepID=A0A506UQ90_9PROT|nr:endonuclease/exonuclease/phosphatase family protein [Oecophyllibacter saccharovorans]TPW35528.1 endonuclease/exonuclease/phosphatase family protein [Oecophyllibacter saccharovorans]TPW36768.1 endonuclease/exonuclease/phosphatase family protein [Oecophyllibacter saccharovorans]